ncbi:Outer membrane protein W precursor [Microbulbifer aggregans]|uniref:Outer membrane protein W n=1 Tax=Microbulbifer aggregans TaxID=1769779 RepID=A0A1C9WB50_9GAMM|nr:OmpW family outer membrane protein [Microbulbifer aggregans]AOS98376.1 Outer membrane protein W precursor [Microbulbifer aggregans]
MRFKPLLIPMAVAGFAGLAAQSALAGPSGYPVVQSTPPVWGAGTFAVRVGAAYVDPDEDTVSNVTTSFLDDPTTEEVEEIPLDVGTFIDIDDDTSWFISATYVFLDHWAVELHYADDVSFEGSLFSDAFFDGEFIGEFTQDLGDFDTNYTKLFVDWYFLDPTCLWQPYVGLGAVYTDVDEDFIRPVFTNDNRWGAGKIGVGSDFSWAAQVGVDVVLGRESNWIVNASAMYLDASPDFSIGFDTETDIPGFDDPVVSSVRVRDADLDLDAWSFNLGIGYKFNF